MDHISSVPGRFCPLLPAAVLLLALCLFTIGAQALTVPMDEAALATGADEVVRGEIADVHADWTADHTNIITTASVTVKGRAKGQGPDTLALTVTGGTVGEVTQWVEDQPVLVDGAEAFIFVRHGPKGDRVYGGAQGVVPIEQGRVRGNGKVKGGGVPADAYGQYLGDLATGRSVAAPASEPAPRSVPGAAPVITGVSPSSASAGTGTVITITGTGFGNRPSRESTADVGFPYRYDGSTVSPIWASGYPYFDRNDDEIVSWSDTEIVVRVPTGRTPDGYRGSASSGFVWVLTDGNAASASRPFAVTFGSLKAKWSRTAESPDVRYVIYPDLGEGEIAAINSATAAWNAALPAGSPFRFAYGGTVNWKEHGWDNANMLYIGYASDFDNPRTLAQTYIVTIGGEIRDCDTVFNPAYAWTTGTAGGSTHSIEHVALHELGHWLALTDLYGWVPGYPADTEKVMFGYGGDQFGNMNLNALAADDIAGIRWIYAGGAPAPTPVPTPTSRPYPGPHVVPTLVQAEDYDAGGEGVAYHDTEPANLGGAYRPAEGVDVETAGGVTDVGWIRDGEWLGYTVNSSAPQSVLLRARAANPDTTGKQVQVSVNGAFAATVDIPYSGGFSTFTSFDSTPFYLPAGAATLRLDLPGRVNLDWLEVVPAVLPATPITHGPTPTPTPTPGPALLIDAPGSYALDRDLASDWAGVVIASSNVVLDGGGHTVEAVGDAPVYVAGAGAGVAARGDWGAPLSNVTVRNLTVRNWWHGIEIEDVENATVEGVVAEGNLAGCRLVVAEGSTVRDSAFRDNPGVGLNLDWRAGTLVENCLVARNNVGVMGWSTGTQDHPLVLSGCEVVENRGSGVVLFDGGYLGAVRNCTIARNEGDGLRLEWNYDPDEVYPGGGSIEANRVEGNAGTGVDVAYWSDARVSGNRVTGNAAGLRAGAAGARAWDNQLNNTVNLVVAEYGTVPALNATPAPGPNVVGGPSVGGNFWAAPDGTGFSETHADGDGDGFCDEPFVTDLGAVDYLPLALPSVVTIPDGTGLPTDTNGDGLYDDVNGNGRKDFADVVFYFNRMAWIGANEPVALFDCNANARIDFADVVWLFNHL